jgi:uncharacterized protein DUF3987
MTNPARPLRVVPDLDPAAVDTAEAKARAQVTRARAELPALDPAAFDCFLGGLVRKIEATSEADPVAILATLIAAAGVHMGQGPHVRAGDDAHPLLVWPLIIGRTNSGRKGSSWSAANRLVHAAVDPSFQIRSGLTSGEGLAARFAIDEEDNIDGVSDPDRDLRLLVFEPEWGGVMAKMRREGNSLSAILRSAWEGGDLSTLTVTQRLAPSSHVGIVAHITPAEFRARLDAADMAGGTYNRFLPLAVARTKFLPLSQGADPQLIAELGRVFAGRLDFAADHRTLGFTGPAATLWRALYVELSADHGERPQVEQFISRAVPNCLRIAAIHAALDNQPAIGPEHLTAAAALVRYSINSARATFVDTATPNKLAAYIAEAGPTGRTRKEITTDHFAGNRKAADIEAVIAELLAAGRITKTTRRPEGSRGGRPAEVYTARDPTKETN